MGEPTISLQWLQHIALTPNLAAQNGESIVRSLRKQYRAALKEQSISVNDLQRCVYVIRMKGEFVIAYPNGRSPVLYIGRGSAFGRIHSHLGQWLYEVGNFGKDVTIEIRLCRPRRRNFPDIYKCVEADLISDFQKLYDAIPFFNSRLETSNEERVDYTATDKALLRAAIGIGKGNRPRWAIAPAPANKNYDVFCRGAR